MKVKLETLTLSRERWRRPKLLHFFDGLNMQVRVCMFDFVGLLRRHLWRNKSFSRFYTVHFYIIFYRTNILCFSLFMFQYILWFFLKGHFGTSSGTNLSPILRASGGSLWFFTTAKHFKLGEINKMVKASCKGCLWRRISAQTVNKEGAQEVMKQKLCM